MEDSTGSIAELLMSCSDHQAVSNTLCGDSLERSALLEANSADDVLAEQV